MPLFRVVVTIETVLEATSKDHARAIFFERQKLKGTVAGKRSLHIEELAPGRAGVSGPSGPVLQAAVEKALATGEEVNVLYNTDEQQLFADALETLWKHLGDLGVLDAERSSPEKGLFVLNNGGSILLRIG